jgi:hypothetical protein
MKKILAITLFLFSIQLVVAQVNVTGYISPYGTAGYPTHIDSLGMGGYMSVSDEAALNAIPLLRRKSGMAVYVRSSNRIFTLVSDLSNNGWMPFAPWNFVSQITTLGSTGPATLVNGVLNIPQYAGGGAGTADGNNFTTAATFNNTTQQITLQRFGLTDLNVNLSNTWPRISTFNDSILSLRTALNGFVLSGHTHSIAQVIGLETALNGKAALDHNHEFLEYVNPNAGDTLVTRFGKIYGGNTTGIGHTRKADINSFSNLYFKSFEYHLDQNNQNYRHTLNHTGWNFQNFVSGGLAWWRIENDLSGPNYKATTLAFTDTEFGIDAERINLVRKRGVNNLLYVNSDGYVRDTSFSYAGSAADSNFYTTGVTFNPTTELLTTNRFGQSDLTTSFSNTWPRISRFNDSLTAIRSTFNLYAPSSHTHTIANVTGLQTALNGKENLLPVGDTNQYIRGNKTLGTFQSGNGIQWDGTKFNLGGVLTNTYDLGVFGSGISMRQSTSFWDAWGFSGGSNGRFIRVFSDSVIMGSTPNFASYPSLSGATYLSTNSSRLYFQGTSRFSVLQGTGTRMVVAAADGSISTQAIPSGGSGSTVTGLIYDRTNKTITLNQTSGGSQTVVLNDTAYSIENAPFVTGSNNLLAGVNDSTSRIRRIRFNGADTSGSTPDLLNVTFTGGVGPADWNTLLNKPATFTPSAHTHAIAEIIGLQAALDGLQSGGSGGASDTLKVEYPLYMVGDTLKLNASGLGGGTGSSAFNDVTSGTNTTATMTVGSGATLNRSGTGIIDANRIQGIVVNPGYTQGQIMQYDANGQFSPANFNLLTVMANGNSSNIQFNSQGNFGYKSGDYDWGQDGSDNFKIRKGGGDLFTIKTGFFGFNESNPTHMLTVRADNNTSGTLAVLFKDFFGVNLFDLRGDGTGTINKKAWQYAADYSSGYTARSLVDKGYVDAQIQLVKDSLVKDSVSMVTTTSTDALNMDTLTTAPGTVTVYDVTIVGSKANATNVWALKVAVKNVGGTYSFTRTIENVMEEDASNDADAALLGNRIVLLVVANSGGTVKWTSSKIIKSTHTL